jgi:hypothetical protein
MVMLEIFFTWQGTVHHKFIPKDAIVKKKMFREVLANVRKAIFLKHPEM